MGDGDDYSIEIKNIPKFGTASIVTSGGRDTSIKYSNIDSNIFSNIDSNILPGDVEEPPESSVFSEKEVLAVDTIVIEYTNNNGVQWQSIIPVYIIIHKETYAYSGYTPWSDANELNHAVHRLVYSDITVLDDTYTNYNIDVSSNFDTNKGKIIFNTGDWENADVDITNSAVGELVKFHGDYPYRQYREFIKYAPNLGEYNIRFEPPDGGLVYVTEPYHDIMDSVSLSVTLNYPEVSSTNADTYFLEKT